jgi:site-specific DNA-methyltransferase (adenine-specific)
MPTQTILEGDCLAAMRKMETASIHTLVTSIPYNFGISYSTYNDSRREAEYFEAMEAAAEEWGRIVRPDGHVFLNVGNSREFPRRAEDVAMILEQVFIRQETIIWVKSVPLYTSSLKDSVFKDAIKAWADEARVDLKKFPYGALRDATHDYVVGHSAPMSKQSNILRQHWEPIYHLSHSGNSDIDPDEIGVAFSDKSNIKRRGHEKDLRCRGNVWIIPHETRQGKAAGGHPATFPLELPRRCLLLAGVPPSGLVLDPYMGTGTTLLAAQQLGLNAIGIDIDPTYCEAARRRLGQPEQGDTSERPTAHVKGGHDAHLWH